MRKSTTVAPRSRPQTNRSRRSRLAPSSTEVVALAASTRTYGKARYHAALDFIRCQHPQARILAPEGRWRTTEEWLAGFQEYLAPVGLLYVLTDDYGWIGKGVWREWQFLHERQVPSMLLADDGAYSLLELPRRGDEDDYREYIHRCHMVVAIGSALPEWPPQGATWVNRSVPTSSTSSFADSLLKSALVPVEKKQTPRVKRTRRVA